MYLRPRTPWYRREIGEPLSWLIGVLSVIVAWLGLSLLSPSSYLGLQSAYIVGIVVGMVVHESMHRNVARRYHMASQYVVNPLGVVITLVSAVLPIKLLAPGYTKVYAYAYGPVSRRGLVRSVAWGPSSNIILSLVALVISEIALLIGFGFTSSWLRLFASINAYLALFNLLPIPPLDGSKLFRWDLFLWALLFVASIVLFIITLL